MSETNRYRLGMDRGRTRVRIVAPDKAGGALAGAAAAMSAAGAQPAGAVDSARESLHVELAGGASVKASLFAPAQARAVIVCLPALGVAAAYYEPLARVLAARGYAAVTADLRGLGESSVRVRRGVDFGYAQLVGDTARIVAAVRARLDAPLLVLGHSLGGHVAALTASAHPQGIEGVVLTACGTPYWRCFPRKTGLQIRLLAHGARLATAALGYFPGRRIGFGGSEAARLMGEWSQLARHGRLRAEGLDAEAAWGALRLPTLAISLAGDWMAPRAAVDHLVGKFAAAPLERLHLGEGEADARALDHFRWVKYPEPVVDALARWWEGRAG